MHQRQNNERHQYHGPEDGTSSPTVPGSPGATRPRSALSRSATRLTWKRVLLILGCVLLVTLTLTSLHMYFVLSNHPHNKNDVASLPDVIDVDATSGGEGLDDGDAFLDDPSAADVDEKGDQEGTPRDPSTHHPATKPISTIPATATATPSTSPKPLQDTKTHHPGDASPTWSFETEIKVSIILTIRGERMPRKMIQEICTHSKVHRERAGEGTTTTVAAVVELILAISKDAPVSSLEVAHITKDFGRSVGEEPSCAIKVVSAGIPDGHSSLGTLMNAGAQVSHRLATHLLFLSSTTQPLAFDAYFQETVAALRHHRIVSCTAVNPLNNTIANRGLVPLMGYDTPSMTMPHIFIQKHMAGLPLSDRRLQDITPIPFANPACMAVDRALFKRLKGVFSAKSFIVDQILKNRESEDSFKHTVKQMHARRRVAQDYLVKVPLSVVARGGQRLKSSIRKLAELLREGGSSIKFILEQYNITESNAPDKEFLDVEQKHLNDMYNAHKEDLAFLLIDLHDRLLDCARKVYGQEALDESHLGVDFSMRAHLLFSSLWKKPLQNIEDLTRDGTVVASTAMANELETLDAMPENLKKWNHGKKKTIFNVTTPLSSHFMSKFGSKLLEMVRFKGRIHFATTDGTEHTSRLRVHWDLYCCECCGFVTEVAQMALPLRKYMDVNMNIGPECFCPGYPDFATDSMALMKTQARTYNTVRQADDFIVMILHRSPQAYFTAEWPRILGEPDYVIGRSMFEFSHLPHLWAENANAANYTDEIWVPSEATKKIFIDSGVDAKKLSIVPEAIDVNLFNPEAHAPTPFPFQKHPRIGKNIICNYNDNDGPRTKKPHIFFSDFKWEPRKGWDVLFSAYDKAFERDRDDVVLYVLTTLYIVRGVDAESRFNSSYIMDDVLHNLRRRRGKNAELEDMPRFCLIIDDLPEEDMLTLYRSADAFVITTRGEGWCLPTFQAMAMALPTIATSYGGQTEYMKDFNSYPVDYELEPLPQHLHKIYGKGNMSWAQPSVESAATQLSNVFNNPQKAREMGVIARKYIVENFSEDVVAKLIRDRLSEIHEREAKLKAEPDLDGSRPTKVPKFPEERYGNVNQ